MVLKQKPRKDSKAMAKNITYKDAGVDIDAADDFIDSVKRIVKPTFRPEVLTGIGGFGSQFALNMQKYKEPVLVASTDGVGTKLRLAFMLNRHDTIGIDLVAMCVNDIIVQGAEPLFMLDYVATGKIDKDALVDVVRGIAAGCKEAGCSLVGGETAEMPSFYTDGEYDVAGFVIGAVERKKIIDGSLVAVGDTVIGIACECCRDYRKPPLRKRTLSCSPCIKQHQLQGRRPLYCRGSGEHDAGPPYPGKSRARHNAR